MQHLLLSVRFGAYGSEHEKGRPSMIDGMSATGSRVQEPSNYRRILGIAPTMSKKLAVRYVKLSTLEGR
jgi:hypothetical protein